MPCGAAAPAIVNVVLTALCRLARIRGDGRDEAAQLALPVADRAWSILVADSLLALAAAVIRLVRA